MFTMNRNDTEAMKYDQGYIWAWYYGNYYEKYNRGYPKEFQKGIDNP